MYTCLETQLERKGGDMKDIINKIKSLGKKNCIIIDIKSIFPKEQVEWQL